MLNTNGHTMNLKEISKLYRLLTDAGTVAKSRPEYSRLGDAIDIALFELDMTVNFLDTPENDRYFEIDNKTF